MYELAVFAAIGAGTYVFRSSLIVLFGRVEVPAVVVRASRYVAPAVLAAIVLPALVVPEGGRVDLLSIRMLAGVVAAVVAWRTRSIPWTVAAGFAAYAAVTAFT